MKSYHWIIVLVLSLLTWMSWPHGNTTTQAQIETSKPTDHLAGPKPAGSLFQSRTNEVSERKVAELKQSIETSLRKRDEFMRKEAGMWSEELKKAVVDATMKRVESRLAPLMEGWAIDSITKSEVLRLFYELETTGHEIYVNSLTNGMKGVSQRRQEQDAEEGLIGFRLESLVGTDRARELIKVRREVHSSMSLEGMNRAKSSKR
jgi:hypothetical protein